MPVNQRTCWSYATAKTAAWRAGCWLILMRLHLSRNKKNAFSLLWVLGNNWHVVPTRFVTRNLLHSMDNSTETELAFFLNFFLGGGRGTSRPFYATYMRLYTLMEHHIIFGWYRSSETKFWNINGTACFQTHVLRERKKPTFCLHFGRQLIIAHLWLASKKIF